MPTTFLFENANIIIARPQPLTSRKTKNSLHDFPSWLKLRARLLVKSEAMVPEIPGTFSSAVMLMQWPI